jgi:hypothetical protein
MYAGEYIYFGCIKYIHEVKKKKKTKTKTNKQIKSFYKLVKNYFFFLI